LDAGQAYFRLARDTDPSAPEREYAGAEIQRPLASIVIGGAKELKQTLRMDALELVCCRSTQKKEVIYK
jgi:hypothetical protein